MNTQDHTILELKVIDLELQLSNRWISVDSHKDVPIGNWLVQLEKESHGCDLAVMKKRSNICIIGDSFSFDAYRVIQYQSLPETSND